MNTALNFFTSHSKTLNIISNPEYQSFFGLSDVLSNFELIESLNVITVIPRDHHGSVLYLSLDDWNIIASKVQFSENLDFIQLLGLFWETQPILVITDVDRSEINDNQFFRDKMISQINLVNSRDIASEYTTDDMHYISQSFDLDKLAKLGIYQQGHCYSARNCSFNRKKILNNDVFFVPIFNIHSRDLKELQQVIVFDYKGNFVDCVVGTEVLY